MSSLKQSAIPRPFLSEKVFSQAVLKGQRENLWARHQAPPFSVCEQSAGPPELLSTCRARGPTPEDSTEERGRG